MKTKLLICLLCSAASLLSAKQILNPDENTLWLEDGIDIKQGPRDDTPGGWHKEKKPLEIESAPGGGFILRTAEKQGRATNTYVKLSADYPYLEMAFENVECINPSIYTNWYLVIRGERKITFGNISEKGIYVCNLNESSTPPKKVKLQIYLHNKQMTIKSMRIVKQPECLIECSSPAFSEKKSFGPGDTVKFKVTLRKPAEDVSLRFNCTYYNQAVSINKQSMLQLKPEDKTGNVWSAEVKIESLASRGRKQFGPLGLRIRASVLGGEVKVPVWTTIPYSYVTGETKK